jgi:beta-galactosidase
LIVGTSVGEGYYRKALPGARGWFKALIAWAAVKPHVVVSEPGVVARVHRSDEKTYLWLTNASQAPRWAGVHINERFGRFTEGTPHWGGSTPVKIVEGDLGVVVNGRDALVLELQ